MIILDCPLGLFLRQKSQLMNWLLFWEDYATCNYWDNFVICLVSASICCVKILFWTKRASVVL